MTTPDPDPVQLYARRTLPLLASLFAATAGVLGFAAYYATGSVVPGCSYVEELGAALDPEDAPLVGRHQSDLPKLSGAIDLPPLSVVWENGYQGHTTSTGASYELAVGVPRSCDGVRVRKSFEPQTITPKLDFELFHSADSDVYRLVALDDRPGGGRSEAGRVALRLKQRAPSQPVRFSFLHIPLLAAFFAAVYGAVAARRPLRDARDVQRRRSRPSEGVFRTSDREDEELAFENRMLLRSMHRDRERAVTPLVAAMLVGAFVVLWTLVSRV
jgi:hypothetical protein